MPGTVPLLVAAHARPLVEAAVGPPRNRRLPPFGAFARLGLMLLAGGLHATGWLFPGAWYAVWVAQVALIGLAAGARPRTAFLYGTAAGAIEIGCSFYWGVAALRQTFDATPVVA